MRTKRVRSPHVKWIISGKHRDDQTGISDASHVLPWIFALALLLRVDL
jgi:hypothetical protein